MTRHEKILATVSRSGELVVVGEGLEAARRHRPAEACPHSGRLGDLWMAGHASYQPLRPSGRNDAPEARRPVGLTDAPEGASGVLHTSGEERP